LSTAGKEYLDRGSFNSMKHLRILLLVLSAAVSSNAMGDKTIFDTTPPPPPPNPRAAAPFVVGLELGANSLGSLVGGHFSFYPFQQLALDFGGGWSLAGMRGGIGARYFLSQKFNAPFVGAAWMRSTGVDSASLDGGEQTWNETLIHPLQFLNLVAGYEFRTTDGLVVTLTTGWSHVLTPEKERSVVKGTLSSEAKDWLDWTTSSGPVVSGMVGYGF
jgi:hypothetical protein